MSWVVFFPSPVNINLSIFFIFLDTVLPVRRECLEQHQSTYQHITALQVLNSGYNRQDFLKIQSLFCDKLMLIDIVIALQAAQTTYELTLFSKIH